MTRWRSRDGRQRGASSSNHVELYSPQLPSAESQCWQLSPSPALDEPLIPGVSLLHLFSNASSVIFASDVSIVSDVVDWHNSNNSNNNNHVKLNKYRKGRAWARRAYALVSTPFNAELFWQLMLESGPCGRSSLSSGRWLSLVSLGHLVGECDLLSREQALVLI